MPTLSDVTRILDRILTDVTRQYAGKPVSVDKIAECDAELIRAYRSDIRVRVENIETGHVRTGIVSRTTGWVPALLLIHRSNDIGSSDVLGPQDRITAVKRGRRYIESKGIYS